MAAWVVRENQKRIGEAMHEKEGEGKRVGLNKQYLVTIAECQKF